MAIEIATLQLELLSATTFGRGDGVAGLVDREVEHDEDGFPFLRGRTLKGLLNEAAEDLVFALEQQRDMRNWRASKERLFGTPGSGLGGNGVLKVGDAQLPENLRTLLRAAVKEKSTKLTADGIFESLTAIRRQTAMNEYGAPEHASLRSMRIVLRGTLLVAELAFDKKPTEGEWILLAGSASGLRAAGTGRNRGRGRVRVTLKNEEWMRDHLARL